MRFKSETDSQPGGKQQHENQDKPTWDSSWS